MISPRFSWRKLNLSFLAILACSFSSAADVPSPSATAVEGNSTIRGRDGNSEIVITTTARLAGAIHSLTWNGKEFINSTDHGRQLQSASNLDVDGKFFGETFNPTEAGSLDDGAGPTSSSKLLKLSASGNQLATLNQMAFWLKPGEESGGRLALNDRVLSGHLLGKHVTIGYKQWPRVISYDVTFTLPKDERHLHAQFEALTGYMPPEFEKFWQLDIQGKLQTDPAVQPGEQARPVAVSTGDEKFAMGIFSPDQPSQEFASVGYGRFRFAGAKVVKWNCVFRVKNADGLPPGDYSYRMFVPVGTLAEVGEMLAGLQSQFVKK